MSIIQSSAADYVRRYVTTAPKGVKIYDGYVFMNSRGQRVEVGNPLELIRKETQAAYGNLNGFTFQSLGGGVIQRTKTVRLKDGRIRETKQQYHYVREV
jgi:hypothetical protein